MAKTKISEFSTTPANNTDIDSINLAEGCAPSGINDAIRELMAQLKDFQTGAVGDSFNGPVGTTTAAAGAFTTLAASGAVTLSGGTANGVAYLNGSKVVTSGSALTFDGTNLALTGTSPIYKVPTAGGSLFDAGGNNGIYILGSSNYVATFAGGSEGMRLTSTGLGIGTSSPTQKLDVAGQVTISSGNGYLWGNGAVQIYSNSSYLRFRTASTDRLEIDSSGNLGLGVTPSAWASFYKGFDLSTYSAVYGASTNNAGLINNGYFNGTNWIYKNTAAASNYSQSGGSHAWFTAPSGTAGNAITFTQAMTLDASGRLGIGTTSPLSKLHINDDTGTAVDLITLESSWNNPSGNKSIVWRDFSNNLGRISVSYSASGGSKMTFGSLYNGGYQSSDLMTLDSGVNFLVGTTSAGGKLTVDSGSSNPYAVFNSTNANGGYAEFRSSGTVQGDIGTASQIVSGGATTDFGINARGSRNLIFGTNNAERARIDSSGGLRINATSTIGNASEKLTVVSDGDSSFFRTSASGTGGTCFHINRSVSTGNFLYFTYGTGLSPVGSINTNGSSTTYSTSSDYRLKNTIVPMTGALAKVALLKPCTYKWNFDGSNGQGFIAHELQAIVPECVTGEKDAVDENGNPKYQGIDTSFLVATLTAAIQELKAEFDAYKASHP